MNRETHQSWKLRQFFFFFRKEPPESFDVKNPIAYNIT